MSAYIRVILCIVLALAAAMMFGFAVIAAGGDTGNAIAGGLIGFLFIGLVAVRATAN